LVARFALRSAGGRFIPVAGKLALREQRWTVGLKGEEKVLMSGAGAGSA
jgi:hypothetical protein